MHTAQLLIALAAVLAARAPLILASMGETISERAGVANLSLDGAMLLAAMVGFAAMCWLRWFCVWSAYRCINRSWLWALC